jgi:hypothetical protein
MIERDSTPSATGEALLREILQMMQEECSGQAPDVSDALLSRNLPEMDLNLVADIDLVSVHRLHKPLVKMEGPRGRP